MKPADFLVLILASVACVLFAAGIGAAGYHSLKHSADAMSVFLAGAVTVTGGVLSTNLGAVIGLSSAQVGAFARHSLLEPTHWLSDKSDPPTRAQVVAAYFYVVALLAGLAMWALTGFGVNEPNKAKVVVDTLPELSKTLLGVAAGALAVGVRKP